MNTRTSIVSFAILMLLLLSRAAGAATYYVSMCGSNAWAGVQAGCAGPLGPKRTIQAAINAANHGDTIIVLAGVYVEHINMNGKAITLMSAAGPAGTIIDGGGSGPIVTMNSLEGPNTVIEGFTIRNGFTNSDGGAGMLIALASPTVQNCTFENNIASGATGWGGGIRGINSSATVSGCRFVNNSASRGGGAHFLFGQPSIIDCEFENNQVTGSGWGGALYLGSSPGATISGTLFQGNTSYDSAGIAAQSSALTVTDCTFIGNVGSKRGGAIGSLSTVSLTVTGCHFEANAVSHPTDSHGGGISVSHGDVSISDSTFVNNSADQFGSAVYVVHHDSLAVQNCNFTGNVSNNTGYGSALMVNGGSGSIIGCSFTGNSGNMGAALGALGASLSVTWSGFASNTVTGSNARGGAISAQDSSIDLGLCTFDGNTAGVSGGAIAVTGGGLSLTGCAFTDNHAEGSGGAVTASLADVVVTSCTFTGNEGLNPAVWGSHGGGLYVWTLGNTVDITECTFQGNAAAHGGGLWVSALGFNATSQLSVSNCTFDSNHAHVGGGGATIGSVSPQTYRVTDCTFVNNTAGASGGALVSTGLGRTLFDQCVFQGNSAPIGGAVSCRANNENYGEAIFSACRFNLNTAIENASAVSVASLAKLRMVNCVVHNNASPAGTGAIADTTDGFWQGRFDLLNCTVANNNGGGIAIDAPQTLSTVSNSIIWGNPNGGQFIGTLPLVRYSNVQGGAPGIGNMNNNPLFQGALGGNYRLLATSPCIDAGHNWLLPQDVLDVNGNGSMIELWPLDFDGNPRVTDNPNVKGSGCSPIAAVVDMGAFETAGTPHPTPIKLGDLNGDGVVDVSDLLVLLTSWGGPHAGCSLADLNFDGFVDVQDLLILLGNWG